MDTVNFELHFIICDHKCFPLCLTLFPEAFCQVSANKLQLSRQELSPLWLCSIKSLRIFRSETNDSKVICFCQNISERFC